MDARLVRVAFFITLLGIGLPASRGASYRTANFVIEAPGDMAEEIGRAAEKYRHDLAIEWLGEEMPNWSRPCPITAKVDQSLGAGGATSFVFEHGEVFGWEMKIQGSRERVLDSVLPHEVTHTIFASHFRQPLPRWADEGACTTVEHESEKHKQAVLLIQFLQSNRGIAFNQMFAMKDYPKDVIPLYAEGYSLARFMIEQGGRRKFVAFVGEGLKANDWPSVTHKHYGFSDLSELQTSWLEWVKKGSPNLAKDNPVVLASNNRPATDRAMGKNGGAGSNLQYRSQMPDGPAAKTETPLAQADARNDAGRPNAGARAQSSRGADAVNPATNSADNPAASPSGGRYFRQNGFSANGPSGEPVTAHRPAQVVFEWSAE